MLPNASELSGMESVAAADRRHAAAANLSCAGTRQPKTGVTVVEKIDEASGQTACCHDFAVAHCAVANGHESDVGTVWG